MTKASSNLSARINNSIFDIAYLIYHNGYNWRALSNALSVTVARFVITALEIRRLYCPIWPILPRRTPKTCFADDRGRFDPAPSSFQQLMAT
jgi:hypothetical protein